MAQIHRFILATTLALATTARADTGTLRIWINGDMPLPGLTKVTERFTTQTGVKFIVEHPQDAPAALAKATAATGPDIIIWAHDLAAGSVVAGLIEPIDPKPAFQAQYDKVAWNALRHDGKLWGYPIAIESVALLYNKQLVAKPPVSFEDTLALDKKLVASGKHAISWNWLDSRLTFPLLAANGGYPFGRNAKGEYVATDVGVNNAGALKGADMLVKLLDAGALSSTVSHDSSTKAMIAGGVAMTISGPWAWEALRAAKVDVGVAPIPSVAGRPSKATIGVQGAMIVAKSTNKELAAKFIEGYLVTAEGLSTLEGPTPVTLSALKALNKTRVTNPLVALTVRNLLTGVVVPITANTERFRAGMNAALDAIAKKQAPKAALDAAAVQIKVQVKTPTVIVPAKVQPVPATSVKPR